MNFPTAHYIIYDTIKSHSTNTTVAATTPMLKIIDAEVMIRSEGFGGFERPVRKSWRKSQIFNFFDMWAGKKCLNQGRYFRGMVDRGFNTPVRPKSLLCSPPSYPEFSIQLMKLSVTNSASTSPKLMANSGSLRLWYS